MAGIAAAKMAAISVPFKFPLTRMKALTPALISACLSKGRVRILLSLVTTTQSR
jgi:hypothetical protein